jgi:hypothetical protein
MWVPIKPKPKKSYWKLEGFNGNIEPTFNPVRVRVQARPSGILADGFRFGELCVDINEDINEDIYGPDAFLNLPARIEETTKLVLKLCRGNDLVEAWYLEAKPKYIDIMDPEQYAVGFDYELIHYENPMKFEEIYNFDPPKKFFKKFMQDLPGWQGTKI